MCLKLSNSGDTLKHIIPSYSRKGISGWSNYPGMVIRYMISENKMGYRGSKSVLLLLLFSTVKEQRVDGSWCNYLLSNSLLRCTLMGFERNYQIKVLSKQFNKTNFCTNPLTKLDPPKGVL